VHADLSAYNILYWEGAITLIDLPQVVDPLLNPQGLALLRRDVRRVCQYFAGYGLRRDPERLADELWAGYLAGELPKTMA
jgi:serine/threonine-protein kinase RIO1